VSVSICTKQKELRDDLRRRKLCINGPKDGGVSKNGIQHGRVVAAGKCQRCLDVHDGPRPVSLTVECPDCHAPVGKQCRSQGGVGRFTRAHGARLRAAAGGGS
jgi:hypothetical protein